jgi:hypothetical protein
MLGTIAILRASGKIRRSGAISPRPEGEADARSAAGEQLFCFGLRECWLLPGRGSGRITSPAAAGEVADVRVGG